MRFLQVLTFYPEYLGQLYQRHPDLARLPFARQRDMVLRDGFGGCHYFAPALEELGWETELVVANAPELQMAWMREKGRFPQGGELTFDDVLRQQVEAFQPDVLYFSDTIQFQSAFLASLARRPRLVAGWRAANIPADTDWRGYDLMLSHLKGCRALALRHGAARAEHFFPGFPLFAYEAVADQQPEVDVVFCGQWTPEHHGRNMLLLRVATEARARGWSVEYHLHNGVFRLPDPVAAVARPATWGLEMYRALRRGRVCLNAEIDLAGGQAGNMRLFESTGVGALSMNQAHANLGDYFEPGCEVAAFRDADDLLRQIEAHLTNPQRAARVAEAGRLRCHRDYNLQERCRVMDTILRRHLDAGSPGRSAAEPRKAENRAEPA